MLSLARTFPRLLTLALFVALLPDPADASLPASSSPAAPSWLVSKLSENPSFFAELPFGEECTTGPCASNPGVGAGQPRKFTGKERDQETGLDYFGARYYASKIGRFTTVDPVYNWNANLLDPQRWNRYAYGRNNPLRYVDPDGRDVFTQQEVFQAANQYQSGEITFEQYQAHMDGIGRSGLLGIALFVPGPDELVFAGLAPRLGGLLGRVFGKIAGAADEVADVAKAARGGESAATKAGREAHGKFAEKVRAKADEGWQSEPTIKGPHGETLKPDAITPSGRPVELKPNTPSGHRRGAAQLKQYEEATGKKGRTVYYDPPK